MNRPNTNLEIDQSVIIVGAGRSGTNMLRDLMVQLDPLVTWPCDEINYIWRHGNRAFPTDEFTREMADPSTAKFIRNKFRALSTRNPGKIVVEKTCANSLRCGFVHQIFPQARFVHIIRDGRDVAASAALRWNAKLDIGYILKKARFVPWSDLPYYASRYLGARLYKLTSGKSRLSTWGPKFTGMEGAFTDNELAVGVCDSMAKVCSISPGSAKRTPERTGFGTQIRNLYGESRRRIQASTGFSQSRFSGHRLQKIDPKCFQSKRR